MKLSTNYISLIRLTVSKRTNIFIVYLFNYQILSNFRIIKYPQPQNEGKKEQTFPSNNYKKLKFLMTDNRELTQNQCFCIKKVVIWSKVVNHSIKKNKKIKAYTAGDTNKTSKIMTCKLKLQKCLIKNFFVYVFDTGNSHKSCVIWAIRLRYSITPAPFFFHHV